MTSGLFHTDNATLPVPFDRWRQLIQERGYQGFIFDCDGTLVESSEVHLKSMQAATTAQGFTMARDWYSERTGLDRKALFADFAKITSGDFDAEEASRHSIADFITRSASVRSIKALQDLARELSATAPLAVGTNAEKEVAEASLRATGAYGIFDFIVTVSDGHAPKPAADIFAAAADLLGIPRNKVLVFEDSVQGVMAAKRAGLDVIQLVEDAG